MGQVPGPSSFLALLTPDSSPQYLFLLMGLLLTDSLFYKEKFVHTSSTFKVKQEDPNNSEDIAAAENEESSNDNDTPVQQYGYEDGKRDHGTPGLLYMNTIKMPQDLKNSYVAFCRSELSFYLNFE